MHSLEKQNKHAVGHAGNGQSALLQGAVEWVYHWHRPLVLFHLPLPISQDTHTHTQTINTNASFIMFPFISSFLAPAALINAVTWAARFPWGKINFPLFRRASMPMVGNGDGTAAVGESLKSTRLGTIVDGESDDESLYLSATSDQDDDFDQAITLDHTITLDQAGSYSTLGHNATLDQDDAFDQAITLDQTITRDQAASYSTRSHNATLDQAITLDLTTRCDQAVSYWDYKPISTASSLPVSSTGLLTPPPSPVASATLPLANLPALDTLPDLSTLSACPFRRRKGVLGGPVPKAKVINEIPAGWPGLAASRWATPKEQPPVIVSSSASTTPTTTTRSPTPATPATPASPATPSTQPPRRRKGVLGGPSPKAIVTNEIPAGWPGLAASRWATPKQEQQQPPAIVSSSAVSTTTPATTTRPTTPATPTPAPPPAVQQAPRRRRKGVLGGPIPKAKVVNEMPAGCAGLAASRWATPSQKAGEASAAGVQASAVPATGVSATGDAKELCVRQVVAAAAAGGGGR